MYQISASSSLTSEVCVLEAKASLPPVWVSSRYEPKREAIPAFSFTVPVGQEGCASKEFALLLSVPEGRVGVSKSSHGLT